MWAALAAVAALTGASAGALALVRNQGVHINGDEPSYLVEAESIARYFTLNSNPGYNFIITHHIVYPFTQKPGPNVAAQMTWEAILRHHLYLPTHSVGLSVLLAVPILLGPTVAIVAFLAMLAALAVGVVHLVGLLAGTRSPWRFALAGVFLVPSYLVASTQVYPDLMTGMIIAIVVLLVALFETKRGCTTAQVVTGGLLLALFPWLAQKNIPVTCLLLVVLVVASRRTFMAGAQLAGLAVPALISLSGVVLFNLWAYGHPLGSKNPVTTSGIETWTRSAALVFDRRSGILIQMPILVLGVAALWVWRRRIPLAVIAAVVLTAAIVYGNGTEPGSQTGGSFNGRYEWPLVPLALAFCALYVIDLWRVRKATVPLIVGIAAALSVFEAVPIILGEHLYYSQIPWDPISYRGWWGGLDPSPVLGYLPAAEIFNLPILTPGGGSGIPALLPGTIPWGNARDLWGLACVLVLTAAVLYYLVRLVRRPARIRRRLLGGLVAAGLVCLVLSLTSPVQLPATVTFSAGFLQSQVGTVEGSDVVAQGAAQDGSVALGPFWEVLPGRYEATIHYVMQDDEPGAALGEVISFKKTDHAHVDISILQSSPLVATATASHHPFVVTGTEVVAVRVQFNGTGTIKVESISLAKLASG